MHGDRDWWIPRFAWEDMVPVKAPPWAKYPFELRRNQKTEKGQPGRHYAGRETTPEILKFLDIHDEESCRRVREQIKRRRRQLGLG